MIQRRDFTIAGFLSLASLSMLTGSTEAQTIDTGGKDFLPAPVLVGRSDAKPDPTGPFFADKTAGSYLYIVDDPGESDHGDKYAIAAGDEEWTSLATSGGGSGLPSSVGANAYPTSNFTDDGTGTTIPLDSTRYDHNNEVDTANDEITVSAAGTYRVHAQAKWNQPGDKVSCEISILVNGSVEVSHQPHASANTDLSADVTVTVELSKGDTIAAQTDQDSGGNSQLTVLGNKEATYVEMIKVGS